MVIDVGDAANVSEGNGAVIVGVSDGDGVSLGGRVGLGRSGTLVAVSTIGVCAAGAQDVISRASSISFIGRMESLVFIALAYSFFVLPRR
jgi:hypothetical protein